jgi:hypothetical protein
MVHTCRTRSLARAEYTARGAAEVLLLALLLGGLGLRRSYRWWIALVVLVLWLLGFLVRVGEGTSPRR